MTSLRTLLNVAYSWLAQSIEGGVEELDKLLGAEQEDEPSRRKGPDPQTAALMAAMRMPQEA